MDPEDFYQIMLFSGNSASGPSPVGVADTCLSRGGRIAGIKRY